MAAAIAESDIRLFIMDKPEFNTLVDEIQFTSEAIARATEFVVDAYNFMPPPVATYTVESFPSQYLLLLGVCGHLLRGAAVNQASNELHYSADGVTIQDKSKASIFGNLGNNFWQEFKDGATQVKINQNVDRLYGSSPSEYSWNR